ncbi:hypothetical protein [Blastococcus atacamensis]|uniref:hypothetical protein n=1 Tax=Blastococcus atacamensis TaxID=2070508 RepID=UPI000CEC0C97|nr:hypothetical protein [Blastococcus atacamensis]
MTLSRLVGRKVEFSTDGAAWVATFVEHGTGSVVVGHGVLTLIAGSQTAEGLVRVQHVRGDHLGAVRSA